MPKRVRSLVATKRIAKKKQGALARVLELQSLCFIEKDAIVFKIEDKAVYDISLAKCDTYDKIIGWQILLSDKGWVDRGLLVRFTEVACDYHGLRFLIHSLEFRIPTSITQNTSVCHCVPAFAFMPLIVGASPAIIPIRILVFHKKKKPFSTWVCQVHHSLNLGSFGLGYCPGRQGLST